MKDIAHHLKHIQKKVIRESRQEQQKAAPPSNQNSTVLKASAKENLAPAR